MCAPILVTCYDEQCAAHFAEALRRQGVDVTAVEGVDVQVPWSGDLLFMFGIFQEAVTREFALDSVAARQQSSYLPRG
jgi:hypothetical protein